MGLFRKKADDQLILHVSDLLNEANQLANTINTTIDDNAFYGSYERLITIFSELIKYENKGIFSESPRKDLQNFIDNRQLAINKFNARKRLDTTKKYTENDFLSIIANSNIDKIDPYLIDSGKLLINYGKAPIGKIQRDFNVGFNRASNIIDQLEKLKVVSAGIGASPRTILMSLEDFNVLSKILSENFSTEISKNNNFVYTEHSNPILNEHHIMDYDTMSGKEFESFCALLLCEHGFSNVETTKVSGDHGIDILAEKDDITYAIQCKCYSSNIGNAAVQQAHTGKSLYHKDIAVVLTNQYFTAQAKEEADALGVKLWDRDKLNDMIEKSSLNK